MRLDIHQLCLVRQRRGAPLPPLSAERTTLERSDLNSHGHNHPDAAVELGRAEAALETVPTLRDGITQVEWDDAVLRSTYRKRFVWLADLVSQYILPLKATAVCLSSATKSLVRSSLDFPDNKALAYAEFKLADSILYPPEYKVLTRVFLRVVRWFASPGCFPKVLVVSAR